MRLKRYLWAEISRRTTVPTHDVVGVEVGVGCVSLGNEVIGWQQGHLSPTNRWSDSHILYRRL